MINIFFGNFRTLLRKIVILIDFVLFAFSYHFLLGASLRCFQCNSLFDRSCGDYVNGYGNVIQSVIDCSSFVDPFIARRAQCRKITYRSPNGGWGYIRGCYQNDHPEIGLIDAETYLCDTDACNSANLHVPTVAFITIVTLIAIVSRIW